MFRPPPCKQACNEPERLERVASIHPIHPSSLAKCVSNGYEHGTREVLPAANGGPAYSCLGRATECFQCVPVSNNGYTNRHALEPTCIGGNVEV